MTEIVIAAYRPLPGQDAELLQIVRDHYAILRAEDLVTDQMPFVMRSRTTGTILEVFEWRSADCVEAAHTNERIISIWRRFAQAAEYVSVASLPECSEPFAHFEALR